MAVHAADAWFQIGRCAPTVVGAPFALRDEQLRGLPDLPANRSDTGTLYYYDARNGIAVAVKGADVGEIVVRKTGAPPRAVANANLAPVATTSGLAIGSLATRVVRLLGKPKVANVCGATYYEYQVDRGVGGNPLEFVIRDGRVVAIVRYYGD